MAMTANQGSGVGGPTQGLHVGEGPTAVARAGAYPALQNGGHSTPEKANLAQFPSSDAASDAQPVQI